MRSESSTVSDEEEQVAGSPMAQVTSTMPVLEPRRDPGPSRGLLIGVLLLLSLPRCRCFDLGQCTAALGMENGEIPDEDISASSMYDPSLGPKHARLRQDKGGGAWCPKNMVTKEGKEYLEVNLHSPRILTSTRTQGRFGNGHGVEYTEEYFVEYWRPGFNKWVRWRNRRGMETLAAWERSGEDGDVPVRRTETEVGWRVVEGWFKRERKSEEDKRETRTFTLQLQSGRHVIFVHARPFSPPRLLLPPCTFEYEQEERKSAPGLSVGKESGTGWKERERGKSKTTSVIARLYVTRALGRHFSTADVVAALSREARRNADASEGTGSPLQGREKNPRVV
ncbi:Discoidin domain-containing receptor 2 [Melipona quadrifasciata]|uniref:Discoidin domain-containing receptor 2 n=1 Tax=Melipona quadrifasciata TaxID=166423 RepID=A0A0M9ADN5_9HYME|nr:Discoidin domain-containing receptor 2 [Melipona quadrifasciata]